MKCVFHVIWGTAVGLSTAVNSYCLKSFCLGWIRRHFFPLIFPLLVSDFAARCLWVAGWADRLLLPCRTEMHITSCAFLMQSSANEVRFRRFISPGSGIKQPCSWSRVIWAGNILEYGEGNAVPHQHFGAPSWTQPHNCTALQSQLCQVCLPFHHQSSRKL